LSATLFSIGEGHEKKQAEHRAVGSSSRDRRYGDAEVYACDG